MDAPTVAENPVLQINYASTSPLKLSIAMETEVTSTFLLDFTIFSRPSYKENSKFISLHMTSQVNTTERIFVLFHIN